YSFMEKERRSRRRCFKKYGNTAKIYTVDFLGVCIAQKWCCSICGGPMSPLVRGEERDAVSIEQSPMMSELREHSSKNVKAAHHRCNIRADQERQRILQIERARENGRRIREANAERKRLRAGAGSESEQVPD